MVNSLFLLSCILGQIAPLDVTKYTPIYSQQGDHAWDGVHQAFFVRTFTTGETYYHRLSFDVPWTEFHRLSNGEAEYQAILKKLGAIDQLPREQLEAAPAIRRLIFFRDLWAVFEKLNGMVSKERGAELRQRVARIMKRLELTDDEISRLPDTLALLHDQRQFPDAPDSANREKPYLPTALLSESSEWIPLATHTRMKGFDELAQSAPGHTNSVNHRSLFSIHMRFPKGRKAGEEFITKNRKEDRFQFPSGTELALLRRAVAANQIGKLRVTNVVESIQLLVTSLPDEKSDARFKFVLDRSSVLAGQPGLIPLELNSLVDAFSFESAGLWLARSQHDGDGELLVLGRGKGHVGVPSMDHCVACHGVRNSNFSANFSPFSVHPTTDAKLVRELEVSKVESDAWQEYLQLREKP